MDRAQSVRSWEEKEGKGGKIQVSHSFATHVKENELYFKCKGS